MIFPIFAPSHPEYVGFDSPRKQIAQGVSIEKVICNEGLVLIIKYNGAPACVKPDTAVILEERNWGGMPPPCCKPTEVSSATNFEECIAEGNPAMESYPRQCRTVDGKHFVEEINDNPIIRQNDFDCFTYWDATIASDVDYKTLEALIRNEITKFGSEYDLENREIKIENIGENRVQIGVQGCWGWPEAHEPELQLDIGELESVKEIK